VADFFSAALLQAKSRHTESLRRWVRQRRADLIDVERVGFLVYALNHGLTWTDACDMTAEHYANTPAGGCTGDAIKQSYKNVLRRSKRSPGRYVLGPTSHPAEICGCLNRQKSSVEPS
jgi:hypothetical protein